MDEEQKPGIRFRGVQLIDLRFSIKGKLPERIPFAPRFNLQANLFDEEKTLNLIFTVDAFAEVSEKERPGIDLAFTFVGQFEAVGEGGMPLREFAKLNAPAHMVPYVRELIANITTRSPLPTLNIGPINVVALINEGQAGFEVSEEKKPTQDA